MKTSIYSTESVKERAFLIGINHPELSVFPAEDCLEELALLADTAGIEVAGQMIQNVRNIDPGVFIGRGKITELASIVREQNIQVVIFDEDLSPAQTKNIEKELNCRVIDRSALILAIFAKRAKTREAKTQVELAQLEYLLPRLTRIWTHLERQAGGSVFTKGPGETQLETDRRLIGKRISVLKKELDKIKQQRLTQRKGRRNAYRVSLVGYTNAGKSTLLNALSDANVYVEDRLFATLDATTRRIFLSEDHHCLVTDTVGFIRKLPHSLVASFRSTLEEVNEADLLVHVVDIGNHLYSEQMETVNQVLHEMNGNPASALIAFNKVDLVKDETLMNQLSRQYPEALFISARRNIGLQKIKAKILECIDTEYRDHEITIPHGHSEILATIRHLADIRSISESGNNLIIRYRSRQAESEQISAFAEKRKLLSELQE